MEASKENLSELEIGNTVESVHKFLHSQRDLFHSQIEQLQNIVVNQCKLTGVNPLSQEMAAGALSINIGKRPRDLLNPKAVKYMQSIFSIKDVISKKESREISALFGVTVTQVREFFASQRSRVRKLVRLSREKSIKSIACEEQQDGVSTSPDSLTPIDLVPLNTAGPTNVEEVPACSTPVEVLPGIDDSEKKFVENIFSLMQKEETFSGQVKLMEWILQMQNSSVLDWFLTKGGVMIIATWLSQAAIEEQTSVLLVILTVLSHLPLHKALPVHMSAILQSVNRLRFYRTSDISNRARALLSKWSKIFARSQPIKKPNGLKSSSDVQKELMLKQSISEIMSDEAWQSKIDNPEQSLAPSLENSENIRNLEPLKGLKLLTASADGSSRKHIRETRERRKVQLVEQPGQRTAGRSQQVTRVVTASQGRPLSADDIQKAKVRAQFMQNKHGKTGPLSNGSHGGKTEGSSKLMSNQASASLLASKVHLRPQIEEQKKPVALPFKNPNQLGAYIEPKINFEPKEPIWEKCKRVQIPWQTPPEVVMNSQWSVGTGENSKEIEAQRNRLRREKETIYQTLQEIPPNPKNPWDIEMDYDDSLTPEIPTEQQPDAENAETEVSPVPAEYENRASVSSAATTSHVSGQISGGNGPEPDLELLAVLLKNPDLVFALTSGQAGNLSSEETVRLLDMIKSNGVGLIGNSNPIGGLVGNGKAEDRVEVSLPSPTPSTNPTMSGWKPEVMKNPFSKQNSMEMLPTTALTRPSLRATSNFTTPPQAAANIPPPVSQRFPTSIPSFSLPQTTTFIPERRPSPIDPHVYQTNPIDPILHSPTPEMNNFPAETLSNVNPTSVSITLNTSDRAPVSFSLPPLLPPPFRPESQPELVGPEPSYMTPPYPARQGGNPGPSSDSWRARQGLASNPYSQVNHQNNYSSLIVGGPVQPPVHPGPSWERNDHAGGNEFEQWNPNNSPGRSPENMPGWNYSEPRMNFGRNPGPGRSRPWNYSGHRDHGRHGNRRWRDRDRDRGRRH